jgi:hypothetical protein
LEKERNREQIPRIEVQKALGVILLLYCIHFKVYNTLNFLNFTIETKEGLELKCSTR